MSCDPPLRVQRAQQDLVHMQAVNLMALTAQHAHTMMEQLPLEECVFVLGMANMLFHDTFLYALCFALLRTSGCQD